MKLAARQCGVPVVLLCQLNREVEGRNGGRPRLSDLRDSGEIEQHADAVILLHVQPDQPTEADVWRVDAIVAKNRNGPPGETALDYIRPILRFDQSAK
jgi:replicative DNA helicase